MSKSKAQEDQSTNTEKTEQSEQKDFQLEHIEQTKEFLYMILDRVYPTLPNFPVIEKHGICNHIKNAFFSCAGQLNLASYVKTQRITHLQRAQAFMELARELLYVSNKRGYISNGFWRELEKLFDDGRSWMTRAFRKN